MSARTESPAPSAAPAAGRLDTLREPLMQQLTRFAPFSEMEPAHVDAFINRSVPAEFATGDRVLSPEDGPVRALYYIRQGAISGRRGLADVSGGGFQYEAGDLFPIGAIMGARAVTATYHATGATSCLLLPADAVRELAQRSAPFADFLNRRILKFLELSQRALQVAYSSQTLAEQSLEKPLSEVARKLPVTCRPETPLADVLATMHQQRIGAMLVTDAAGTALGILTRYDILGRVTLPQVPLDTPVSAVMTQPVHTLTVHDTAQDAALLMSRHGVRHVPVTQGGRVVSIVSERDLFAMQRLSLKQVSTAIRSAQDVPTLQLVANDIRSFARNLLGQGVRAKQLTELISHLNDVLAERLVELLAARHGRDMTRACWLAFGSEGRSEQTIATDQDNGLVFESDDPARDRPAWLAFARDVNQAMDACGYPLCRGNIMAGNPDCCLTPGEWHARFEHWIEHGAPEDLLKASIFFDFRALAGESDLVRPMREFVTRRAQATPRFQKQLADNALRARAPLGWLGGIETTEVDHRDTVDLKLQGTALFVDAARLYALAHGVTATNTRERLEAAAAALRVDHHEGEAWVGAFEFLQLLRLHAQIEPPAAREVRDVREGGHANPNRIDVGTLNDLDRRILKESFRVARRMQQRIELDYMR